MGFQATARGGIRPPTSLNCALNGVRRTVAVGRTVLRPTDTINRSGGLSRQTTAASELPSDAHCAERPVRASGARVAHSRLLQAGPPYGGIGTPEVAARTVTGEP